MRSQTVISMRLAGLVWRCSVHGVSGAMKKLGIDRLDTEQRLSLIEEIWESLDEQSIPLMAAQHAELENRLVDHESNPDDIVPLEELRKTVLPPRGDK